ncbi:MAG: nucleoside triphosphate pyrophosphohydrolase [Ilumatobacteraceae bacterium]
MTTPRVTVVGLGPGPSSHVTQATLDAIAGSHHRYVRTMRHESVSLLGECTTFDDLYEALPTFDDVYRAIVERLVEAATAHGEVLYAVPGSPLILESSVALLRADPRVEVVVVASMSFLDLAWNALGIDPVNEGVRVIDGHRFAQQAANERGPLLVTQTHAGWVLSDIKLAHDDASGDEPVVILHHLGLSDERVIHTTWSEMDRTIEADHLTSLYIPTLGSPIAGEMVKLHQLARTLREQCPWDREQTHSSLIKHLLEETYEAIDALENLSDDDPSTDEALIEELGDLLYQVEFHATIAEQQGRFTMADVARTLHDKLVRRHPHVFGDATAQTADDVVTTWDGVKQQERLDGTKKDEGIFTGVAKAAPALSYATKLQKRAAGVGFDWPDAGGAYDKIVEESRELREAVNAGADPETVSLELGDLLFSVVNLSRHLSIDAEGALRAASNKFRARFELVEQLAAQRSIDMQSASLETLDQLWDLAKGQ